MNKSEALEKMRAYDEIGSMKFTNESQLINFIREAAIFDETWYLGRYPDVAKYPFGPLAHFARHGYAERRSPGQWHADLKQATPPPEKAAGLDSATRAKMQKYQAGMGSIHGWFDGRNLPLFEFLDQTQRKYKVTGGVAEIGPHHGKSFIPLAILKSGCQHLVVDVFEDQFLNPDPPYPASRQTFEKNLAQYAPGEKVMIINGDSTYLSDKFINDFTTSFGFFSVFSIDGAHTCENTYSDLLTAQRMCHSGSLIFLDDYYNSFHPGVHEAFMKYLFFTDVKFAPLYSAWNKMCLCDRAYHPLYFAALGEYLTSQPYRKRIVNLGGHPFYAIIAK